ncbi:hypothetical protein ABPG72_004774 [Tetrahymena utriculariae]
MGKKRRVQVFTGSMLQPLYRYLLSAKLGVNPLDLHGQNIAKQIFLKCKQARPKYLQNDFNATLVQDNAAPASYFHAKFINGYEQKWYLHKSTEEEINRNLKYFNYQIEMERNLQGHDDEYEDEETQL